MNHDYSICENYESLRVASFFKAAGLLLFLIVAENAVASPSFVTTAAPLEKVVPIQVWVGISLDNEKLGIRPENGLITNQQEWTALWQKWHPDEPQPAIDFAKDIVLVDAVSGPNRMRLGRLIRVKDSRNDVVVKFNPISTKKGGAGFGHILVQIARDNIDFVNGVAVPKPVIDQPVVDGVEVNIVGTLQTGLMAIGGETTGTTITAGNIVWELQTESGAGLFAEFHGRRARVTGRLTKRTGTEIAVRWIVHVAEISDPEGIGNAVGFGGQQDNEKLDAFVQIQVQQSGGIAGMIVSTSVDADGTISKSGAVGAGQNGAGGKDIEMPRERLSRLHQLVRDTDWAQVPAKTRNMRTADAFQFNVSIVTSAKTWTFVIDQASLNEVPSLRELFSLLL